MGPTNTILDDMKYINHVDQVLMVAKLGDFEAMLRLGIEYVHVMIDIRRDIETESGLKAYHNCFDDFGVMMVNAIFWLEHAEKTDDIDIKRQANYWMGECMFLFQDSACSLRGYIQLLYDDMKKDDYLVKKIEREKESFLYRFLFDDVFSYTAMLDFYRKASSLGDTSAAYRLGGHFLQKWMATPDDKQYFIDAKKYLSAAILPKEEYALMDLFDALEHAR